MRASANGIETTTTVKIRFRVNMKHENNFRVIFGFTVYAAIAEVCLHVITLHLPLLHDELIIIDYLMCIVIPSHAHACDSLPAWLERRTPLP